MIQEFHLVSLYSCHKGSYHPRVKIFNGFYPFYKILPCSPFPIVHHSPTFPYQCQFKHKGTISNHINKGISGKH